MEDLKIGDSLARFQAALIQAGGSMGQFILENYIDKWCKGITKHYCKGHRIRI